GAVALAIPLPGFQGLLEVQTQPRTSFLKEFSDRIRVIACIDELPNLALSTQDVPTLSSGEWDKVAKACGVGHEVPILVVWGARADAETAVREIAIRAREATVGVPNETRQALDDGTTGFERILPGADRMYPDTDLPPIALDDARVDTIRASLPLCPWEREARARELGVGADLAERLGRHRAWDLFVHLAARLEGTAVTAHQVASLLLDRSCPRPASLAAAAAWWDDAAARLAAGDVICEGVWAGEDAPVPRLDDTTARQRLREALAALADPLPVDPRRRELVAMGHVMPALRGRAPGALVRRWLKEELA
ncbi:MAG: hypothetical protein ABR506_02180, partial [Candidatus Krumholzibacteriia bacterium]